MPRNIRTEPIEISYDQPPQGGSQLDLMRRPGTLPSIEEWIMSYNTITTNSTFNGSPSPSEYNYTSPPRVYTFPIRTIVKFLEPYTSLFLNINVGEMGMIVNKDTYQNTIYMFNRNDLKSLYKEEESQRSRIFYSYFNPKIKTLANTPDTKSYINVLCTIPLEEVRLMY